MQPQRGAFATPANKKPIPKLFERMMIEARQHSPLGFMRVYSMPLIGRAISSFGIGLGFYIAARHREQRFQSLIDLRKL